VIKDFEMCGPTFSDKCPYKRLAEG
jgi:hypothetical protein